MRLILAANEAAALQAAKELVEQGLLEKDFIVIKNLRTIEGLRFRYEDVIRVPGWSTHPEIEDIENRILRTHIIMRPKQAVE